MEQCIVCITVQYGNWNPKCIVEGSVKKICSDCQTPIYLSKSGQALIATAPHTKMFCQFCVKKEVARQEAKGEEVKTMLLPEMLEEAKKALDKETEEK